MKYANDVRAIERVAAAQRGVFSKADLQTLLAEPHTAAFRRRFQALETNGVLRRFCRGIYVAETFDLPTLSQRIAPSSYISFGTVLAATLTIGTQPQRQILSVDVGKSRRYERLGYEVVYVGIAPHLVFGIEAVDGVRTASVEKAILDVLYFHLRGRKYTFDIYADIDFTRIDRRRIESYLQRYRNPKFVAFARDVLGLS